MGRVIIQVVNLPLPSFSFYMASSTNLDFMRSPKSLPTIRDTVKSRIVSSLTAVTVPWSIAYFKSMLMIKLQELLSVNMEGGNLPKPVFSLPLLH
jgi:hypothetical protein